MTTRRCRDLDQAILATTRPQYFAGHTGEHFSILAGQCAHTVWGGDCYNYALLASGHVDIVVEAGLKLHDLAALVPVVEGAGGRMCDWSGEAAHPMRAKATSSPSAIRRASTMSSRRWPATATSRIAAADQENRCASRPCAAGRCPRP